MDNNTAFIQHKINTVYFTFVLRIKKKRKYLTHAVLLIKHLVETVFFFP